MIKQILSIPVGWFALGVLVPALAAQSAPRPGLLAPVPTTPSWAIGDALAVPPPRFEEPPVNPAPAAIRTVGADNPAQPVQQPALAQPVQPAKTKSAALGVPVVSDDSFNSREPQTGLSAGGSFYFLKPYFQNNTATVTTINPGQPNSQVINDSFNWNFQPTFAGWIGWTSSSGLGIRARYFQFDASSNTSSLTNGATPAPQTQTTINPPLGNFLPLSTGGTAFGSPGTVLNTGFGIDQLTVGSDLRIHTIDLEATYAWQISRLSFLAFAGGRYLELVQDYRATLINNGGGATISELQVFNSDRKFSGGGPTFGLQATLPIGRTGLSLFASGRGSLLVGTVSESALFSQTINDPTGLIPGHIPPPAILQINPTGTRNSDHVISSADIELGVEYGHKLGCTWVFFRGTVVNQTYFDGGNASQSTGNLSLFGVQATIGINY